MDDSEELRAKYLSQLAESYAEKNDISLEKVIHELILHEEEREIYKTIRARMKKFEKSQLEKIWVCKKSNVNLKER